MSNEANPEARIVSTNNILLVLSELADDRLPKDFCGAIMTREIFVANALDLTLRTIYLSGDISQARGLGLEQAARVFIVQDLSFGYGEKDDETWPLVDVGQIPILVHGMGVYYRRFFDDEHPYFQRICAEHTFQALTESTKPGKAHRTGIYLTPVEQKGDELHFRLLRCSTNLSGPSENFRANDRHIVDALNQEAHYIFQDQAPLNHVLAQIYNNTPASTEHKQTKAKISSHADKTKDMPIHGIMAFCTFYEHLDKLRPLPQDPFDYGIKGISGLTRLHFRLKVPGTRGPQGPLPAQFTVTLYPNSVFFMPLSTNRLYTHEIQSSMLEAEKLPTRLGYVVRCSSTEAVHVNGQTFLAKNGNRVPLEPATPEGMQELRRLYAEENKTQDFIDYGDRFLFSMNQGDYRAPTYQPSDEFRAYSLATSTDLFDELRASVRLENVGKGRQGAVLVEPTTTGSIPIVRTTTPYAKPAQCFRPVLRRLARQIQRKASLPREFNNALFEVYSNLYTTMGSHSDQALDLADESFIALFSCYKYPEKALPPRKLIVESKIPNGDMFEVPLLHNSVVVFSLDTNRRFRHKIVLTGSTTVPENEWLGITFRTAKTLVRFQDDQMSFLDGTPLTLATDEEKRAFFRLRRRENQELDFSYPPLTYTLSPSDRMPASITTV